MKSTQPIEFTEKEFLNEKYLDYSVESIGKVNGIIYYLESGIYAISSVYSKFITNILSSLNQIDSIGSNTNKKVSSAIEYLRKAIVFNLNNQIDDINNLKDDYPKLYNVLTRTTTIESEEESIIPGYSYKLSLKYIKSSIDKLLLDIKRMVINRNIFDWKKYFDIIESDLKDIYNEIVAFEYLTTTVFMEQSAIDKIDKMRSNSSRINKIKIKSISDIPSQTYEVLKTLDEFYHMFIRTHYEMLKSVSICDPDGTVSHFGEISKIHEDLERYDDSDFGGIENNTDDIEDFVDDTEN